MKSLLVSVALSMSAIAAQAYDDIDVGMCAMYHVVIGNKSAAAEVERKARDTTRMKGAAWNFYADYKKKPEVMLTVGKRACQEIGFRY